MEQKAQDEAGTGFDPRSANLQHQDAQNQNGGTADGVEAEEFFSGMNQIEGGQTHIEVSPLNLDESEIMEIKIKKQNRDASEAESFESFYLPKELYT